MDQSRTRGEPAHQLLRSRAGSRHIHIHKHCEPAEVRLCFLWRKADHGNLQTSADSSAICRMGMPSSSTA
jgi:hypothetical protein